MEQRILVVAWHTKPGYLLEPVVCQIAHDALRLSVWRAGGIAFACRVTPTDTRMVIHVPPGHDPGLHIEWVRAAARFAVARMSAGAPPAWDDAYTYSWVRGARVASEITACLMHDVPWYPQPH